MSLGPYHKVLVTGLRLELLQNNQATARAYVYQSTSRFSSSNKQTIYEPNKLMLWQIGTDLSSLYKSWDQIMN